LKISVKKGEQTSFIHSFKWHLGVEIVFNYMVYTCICYPDEMQEKENRKEEEEEENR